MAPLASLVSYLTLVVFTFGQLLRLNLFGLSFPVIDIFILLLAILNLSTLKTLKISNRPFFYFSIFSLFSLILNLIFFHHPFPKPFFYWLRLAASLSFFIFGKSPIIFNSRFQKLFDLVLISNIVFGLIQYVFWPNFTYFDSFNWDPHLYRLVSTFFDPTFTGLIYLMFLISLYLIPNTKYLIPLVYIAFALTYSRSSLLALLITSVYFSIKTHQLKTFGGSLVVVFLTIILLPRLPGEGTKLERTSSLYAKVENYREALKIFSHSPVIGVGYNNLAYIRNITNPDSHANFGFDSSLLTILTTTGLIGFSFFVLGIVHLLTAASLQFKALLVATLIHSLFANSLLYPWVLLLLVVKYRK